MPRWSWSEDPTKTLFGVLSSFFVLWLLVTTVMIGSILSKSYFILLRLGCGFATTIALVKFFEIWFVGSFLFAQFLMQAGKTADSR